MASTSSASPLSSSTSLSFSFLSTAISSYSFCNRSIVFWLAIRFSSAWRWARSSLSCALESCFWTRCYSLLFSLIRKGSEKTYLMFEVELTTLNLFAVQMVFEISQFLLGRLQGVDFFLNGLELFNAASDILSIDISYVISPPRR